MHDSPSPTRRTAPRQEGPSSVEVTTTDTADDTAVPPLRRRSRAARRVPPLVCGHADPWLGGHQDWRDAHDLAMTRAGLAPAWQVERARQLWRDGAR